MNKTQDIHNYKRRLERTIERINESSEFNKHNKKIVMTFKNSLLAENIGTAKTSRYLQDVIWLNKQFKGKKNFDEAKREDIVELVANMNQSELAESTKKGLKIMLRKLYRHIRGITEKGKYPEEVDFYTLTISNSKKLIPEELLTEEEVLKIIRNTRSERDRALLASLFESGCRVGEIGSMQIKHVSFEKMFAKLTVRGKTGMRKIMVINSIPYLQSWINHHPQADDPNAPLWVNPQGGCLSYATIRNILRKSSDRAGIKKKVHPHLLRHTRATMMASQIPEAVMKNYFGWGQDSKMCGTYIHLNGETTDKAIMKMNGIEVEEETKESVLKSPKCLRCYHLNEFTAKFCKNCGLSLNEEEAMKILKDDNQRQKADELMKSLMNDPEVLALLKKKIGR